MDVQLKPKSSTISAVVTRADGTVEDYGMIAYWHSNPVLRLLGRAYVKVRRYLFG